MSMEPVDKLMQDALERDVFPGAVLLVAKENTILFHKAYGVTDLSSKGRITCKTIFDLASLTKPLTTALAVMQLCQSAKVDLDLPIVEMCADFHGTDKAQLTLRQLLCHRSGLPPWKPYYKQLRNLPQHERFSALKQMLLREPLQLRPGLQAAYSDLGFLLVQWIVEAVSGQRLDHYVHDRIYLPLKVESLFFNPIDAEPMVADYAATEYCSWRKQMIKGRVHDDNAYVIGGVAGHAGLFGSAMAVFHLLSALQAAERNAAKKSVFASTWIQVFFERQKGGDWALGFDTPASQGSSAGRFFSKKSVGHLGFTGTSFWMDRQSGVIVILLTNRVHLSKDNLGKDNLDRDNPAIRQFRPQLHDQVMIAITG